MNQTIQTWLMFDLLKTRSISNRYVNKSNNLSTTLNSFKFSSQTWTLTSRLNKFIYIIKS